MTLDDTGRFSGKIPVILLAVFVTVLASLFASHTTHALSNNGPDSADYGNSSARYALEDDAQLRVTSSTIPVYYSTNPGTVTVTANSFSFENSTSPHPSISFNGRSGVQSNTTFPVSGFTYDPNTGYFVALITAKMVGETGSTYNVINWKLSIPGSGIIGTYAANGSNSAIELPNRCDGSDSSGCGRYYNYSLPFGTQCQAQGNQLVSAKIYDGDNGNVGVQPTNFGVSIFDETDNRTVPHSFSGGEGDGQTASYTFTVQPYHKYRFKVNNVYANNVMQINLPYDGITYLSNCRALEVTNRIYGSWGEYGVMATGLIKGIGSGSAFAGHGLAHATTCSYTFLTIANATTGNCKTTPAANYGGFKTGKTIPDVAASFPISSAAATLSGNSLDVSALSSGTYKTSGNITLTGGTLPKGRTIVINTYNAASKKYADITIAGNITYTTDALTSANQIPQLVLIAGNINIHDNVTQVDGWLSAEGTLNTCSNVNRTSITVNNCNQLLTINGPVMAKDVQLWRTAGSLNGDDSGAPAEVFNLRPDAYLWGLSLSAQSGRLETVYTHELPPRF